MGIGKQLINQIEGMAAMLDCCKLTLEVQEKNECALHLYENCGFEKSILDIHEGNMLFLSKYFKNNYSLVSVLECLNAISK